ncbi:MAG: mandelate racemase/muconate lactonizing enzyme family protein [Methylobacteriaceae bacterium]|nr:mandelate racemase/muconate lactonizing enzyme family protein [Methylobacteriaceae bacterium]
MVPSKIRKVEAFCYRVPLAEPVVTSFGRMQNRPAVFVRVTDDDGFNGWGEAWCNFPSVGAEHRARIITDVLGPTILGKTIYNPTDLFSCLTQDTEVVMLQSGERGPFAQAIAGLDIAIWDLFARRERQPLWRMLGGAGPVVDVYASGINPDRVQTTVERAQVLGHRAFKLKIGFDPNHDRDNLAALRRLVNEDFLAADVNQAWSTEQALRCLPALQEFELAWLEEPLRADVPWSEWGRLREAASVPLAAGENIFSSAGFAGAISANVLSVIQPDVAKWGGITMCARVAREVLSAGRRFCPHYLGGGIGLLASAHLLAGVGGDGILEVDINPNPLRDTCCGPMCQIRSGQVSLLDEPGLGVDPDLQGLANYRTL